MMFLDPSAESRYTNIQNAASNRAKKPEGKCVKKTARKLIKRPSMFLTALFLLSNMSPNEKYISKFIKGNANNW